MDDTHHYCRFVDFKRLVDDTRSLVETFENGKKWGRSSENSVKKDYRERLL